MGAGIEQRQQHDVVPQRGFANAGFEDGFFVFGIGRVQQ
jgi:hypothetical protein